MCDRTTSTQVTIAYPSAYDSDTVAPTLIFLFYELALHPEKAEKLYQEVKGLDDYDPKVLQGLPYLNAVIKETLRLHPAVPTGGYRDTPPHGMTIGDTFIPGNTTIVAPRYVLGRRKAAPPCAEYEDTDIDSGNLLRTSK